MLGGEGNENGEKKPAALIHGNGIQNQISMIEN